MMKKNIFAAFAATVLLSLFAVSCAPKDDAPEEATLSLSANTLVLTNGVQSPAAPQITVTTNQPKFTASSNASWLQAEASGNGVKISALANDLGKDRQGDVLVFAGGLVEKIVVTQSAADIVLAVSPADVNVSRKGQEILISVKSNAEAWTVALAEASNESWIKLEQLNEFVKVVVSPNATKDVRTASIIATAGTKNEEINLTQQGIGGVDYLLPLLKRQPTAYELINYETSQDNFMISYAGAAPSWGIYDEIYTFAYGTKAFQICEYNIDITKGAISKIHLYFELTPENNPIATEAFQNYLKDNNFTDVLVSTEGSLTANYENGEEAFEVTTLLGVDMGALVFTPVVKQTKEYPTFKAFPWDKYERLNNQDWITSEIEAAEKADGNTAVVMYSEKFPELPTTVQVTLKASTDRDVPHTRLYFIDTDENNGTSTDIASELLTVWEDVELMAYEDGNAFVLTKEFKDLLAANGFVFNREAQGYQFYYNEAKQAMIVPRGARFSDLLDGQPVCSMNYFFSAGTSAKMNSDSAISEMVSKLQKEDKKFGLIK